MTSLTLHQDGPGESQEAVELADRMLAMDRSVVIVAAPRSLTIANRGGFRDHVRQQLIRKPVGLVIDCAFSEHIDSSGLGLLFSFAKEARRDGIGYRVTRLAEDFRTLLSATRIDTVVQVAETLRVAILEASIAVDAGQLDIRALLPAEDEPTPRPWW